MEFNKGFAAAGIEVLHHFGPGFYVKECHIPGEQILEQHVHKFDHLSWLSAGSVVVEVDGKESLHQAPAMIEIPAGKQHTVRSLTDVVWLCMHATDETDANKIDESLV
jgi:mannose-6-phosphate isomerase-like protein (cupin superfamily)